jgi:Kef-type K+ transport system membrane component KefB
MLARTFLAIAVIVLVARLTGVVFLRFRQPLVIGEIVGGILLGPTVLGAFGAGATHALFPAKIRPSLDLIGQLGLVLYMFMVGLHLNFKTVRSNKQMVSKISLAAVLLPLALAMPLAAFLYTGHHKVGGHSVDRLAFFLFVGVSLSITAFPVLARILDDRRMHGTEVGTIATACAAVQDVLGWVMLAVVLAIVSAHGGAASLARIGGESVLCVGGIALVSRVLGRLDPAGSSGEGPSPGPLLPPAVIACVLLCAAATQAIGLHAIFGAFICGVALRRSLSVTTIELLVSRVRPLTVAFLLPVYFIGPGLHVNLRDVGSGGVGEIALILLAACGGKLIGAYVAARASGLSARQSAIMGSLMNTRGLIELVVLQVALGAGILDGRLFSELVFMAVVTTMMTPLLLSLLMKNKVGVAAETSHSDVLALSAH